MNNCSTSSSNKVTFLHSIKAKILLICIFCSLLIYCITFTVLIKNTRTSFQTNTSNYMSDVCSIYSKYLDTLYSQNNNQSLTTNTLEEILKDVGVKGMETSYAYVVSKDGTMLYHPTSEKIGIPVENSVVKNLVEQLKMGQVPENTVVPYTFHGTKKFASYCISPLNHQILVITLDLPELDGYLQSAKNKSFILCSIALLILIALSYMFSTSICKPLNKLKDMIEKIAYLDLTSTSANDSLNNRKDEIGMIAHAMLTMRSSLHKIVLSLKQDTSILSASSKSTNDLSYEITDTAMTNSSTTQELAAAMEEASSTSTVVGENIDSTASQMSFILDKTQAAFSLSEEIMERALSLEASNRSAAQKALKLYQSVKSESQEALKNASEAQRINELTSSITEISRQTSLLSLNASIEAARAGEEGKGFAIVAQEIGLLATESSNITSNITEISIKVINAVTSMSYCLDKTLSFIEQTVLEDYNKFITAGIQYHSDAQNVTTHLDEINKCAKEFNMLTLQINEYIHGINSTIQESAISINCIAEKTSDFTKLTNTATENAENISKCISDFENLIHQFKL